MRLITLGTTTLYLYLSLSLFYNPILLKAYDPIENFSISCGSNGNSFDGDRTWTRDTNSELLSLQDNNQTLIKQAPSTNQVPYTTARLSFFQFTYFFHVTAGPKFVRLFFYPDSYPAFDRPYALFTVKSGGFTLLKDFNASLAADVNTNPMGTIFKEYIIHVGDDQRLNLTFTPSTSHPNSYAFVNGIEIVSMPFYLYYTDPEDFFNHGIKFVGHLEVPFTVENNTALETQYRLNLGGRYLPPRQDSGMLRSWESDDTHYLSTSNSATPIDLSGREIHVTPNYTAPMEIYETGRSMGNNATLNKMSNLTWEFPVDSGFYYLLRLHFCEILYRENRERDFYIYIAGQMAEDRWLFQIENNTAVYQDYVVFIPGNNENHKKANLSLQMHPVPESSLYNVLLNGLEVFKISDADGNNLAGPNPDTIPLSPTALMFVTNPNRSYLPILIGVVSVVMLSIIVFYLNTWGLHTKNDKESKSTSFLPSELCRRFSLVEMRVATNNFDEVLIIGVGGFGNVYKVYIENGGATIPVAIKRLRPGSRQGAHEFVTEIQMLSQLRHQNLVSLVGYCFESNEMMLAYDFMPRGTLCDHLYHSDNPPLSWKQRLRICIGAARGLQYLHKGAVHNIIHRDVKTTNILLDEKWEAKVSDFGLSRMGPTGVSKTHISTVAKGSMGYLDPEYYKRLRLIEKSDVYSFGVVLFEVLCARPALMSCMEKRQMSLADWARECCESGTVDQIVDPILKGKIAPECLKKYCDIAVSCLLDDGAQRPSMNDVLWTLEFVLQLQEGAETEHTSETMEGTDEDDGGIISNNSAREQISVFSESSAGHQSYGSKESEG